MADVVWHKRFGASAVVLGLGMLLLSAQQAAVGEEDWHSRMVTPDPAFSQMPFWFWNDELDDAEIKRQMAEFRQQGVYGFVIHARIGLPKETPFMGERWLHHVRVAVEEAARTGMRVCLYDEGMYPSGSAHGQVVRSDAAFAAQGLMCTHTDVTGPTRVSPPGAAEGKLVATIAARLTGERDKLDGASMRLLDPASAGIDLAEGNWRLMSFSQVPSGGHIRGVHEGEDDREPDAPPAADLLNPEAMKAFIRYAYEPYHATVGEHFGKTVIGMFTDEPSFLGRGGRRGLTPWTGGFEAHFERFNGYPLLPLLPALFFNVGERTARIRTDYELALARRLDETYYGPISQWCESHGIALTGHPAGSHESMPLRHFQIPGQDVVWRYVAPGTPSRLSGPHSNIARCSSSVARHDGRRRNANEVYGAYGWHLTMEEMKWVADWLMVRGVNLLYPHAFYYSIRDYRVHERPPDLGPHNAWWAHYRFLADYTARVCGLMADSRHVCGVAVLATGNNLPSSASKVLQEQQVDFNFLEDWRLVEQAKIEDGRLAVGTMNYTTLVIDPDAVPAGKAAECVSAFESKGGRVVRYEPEAASRLVERINRDLVCEPPVQDLRATHVSEYGIDFYYLVNEGETECRTVLSVPCLGAAEWFDPWTGEFRPAVVVRNEGGHLAVPLRLERRQSIVLAVDVSKPAVVAARAPMQPQVVGTTAIEGPWRISDSQRNSVGDRLGDWEGLPVGRDFAGTLTYSTTFEAAPEAGCVYELDLGTVGDWAVIRVNGEVFAPRFWKPYLWDVSRAVRQGRNEVAVEVTNSLAARLAAKDRRPSGLFGPAVLKALRAGDD